MEYKIYFDTVNNLDNFVYTHVKAHYITLRTIAKNNSYVLMTESNHPKKEMIVKAKNSKGYVFNT